MFISNNRPSFHLWLKENLVKHPEVSKYYQADCNLVYFSIWVCDLSSYAQNTVLDKFLFNICFMVIYYLILMAILSYSERNELAKLI